MAAVKTHEISVDGGGTLYAESAGDFSKPALVFVHGTGLTCDCWDVLFHRADLQRSAFLIRYDLRGFGRSQSFAVESINATSAAADFAAVVRATGKERATLVGWSLGATIAADVYASEAHASTLDAVVYVAPLPWIGPIQKAIAKPELAALVPGLFTMDNVELSLSTSAAFVGTLTQRPLPWGTRLAFIGASALSTPASRKAWLTRAMQPSRLQQAVREGKLRLLHLHGENDRQIDGKALEAQMREVFGDGFQVQHIANAGHALFIDQPDQAAGALIKFAA